MRNTLLIIDDSELDRAIFNEIFKKDYRVLRAATAYEGVDQVRKHTKELAVIVLDICLQRGPSGFAVLEKIRDLEGGPRIPVILLTAEAEPEWVYRGVEMGAVDFLVKPLAPVATQNRIKSIIEEAWGDEEEEEEAEDPNAPAGKIPLAKAEELTQWWQKNLLSFCQFRDPAFASYVQRLRIITSALASAYCSLFPECGLTSYDAKLIGMAAGLAEIGQLALPDEVLLAGPNQPEPGRSQYVLHARLGGEFFKGGPKEWEPLMTYCAEAAIYHHKDYDGSGFPPALARDNIPLSAQLVHTAMLCSDLADRYEEEHNIFKMVYRALSLRSGSSLSPQMLKAVEESQKPLEHVFRTMRPPKRVEDQEKKLQVREALTTRPDSNEQPAKGLGVLGLKNRRTR